MNKGLKIALWILGALLLILLVIWLVNKFKKPPPDDKDGDDDGGNGGNGNGTTEPPPPVFINPSAEEAWKKAFNPSFWKGQPNALILTVGAAREKATKIYDAIGYLWDSESTIVNEIKSLKTKSQVSFVAQYFLEQYQKELGTFILINVDKSNNQQQIQQHIAVIPDYFTT